MNKLLYLEKKDIDIKYLLLYIIGAYILVVLVRLIMLQDICATQYLCDGSYISPLWSYDGGLYGYYAKELLAGHKLAFTHEFIPGYLLFYLVKLTGLSLNQIIFYSPIFIASLSVLPAIWLGYIYKIVPFSFFAAIIGNLTFSYYARTHLGYFDTDVLNVTLSMLLIVSMINFLEYKKIVGIFYIGVSTALLYYWYHSSLSIIFFAYGLFLLFLFIKYFNVIIKQKKYLIFIFIFIILLFYFIDISFFYERALDYMNKDSAVLLLQGKESSLRFNSALSTVDEAQKLNIHLLGYYLGINNEVFYLSLFSLILFGIQFRSFIMCLPLIALALLSIKLGIRFSEYGALVISFGTVYLCYIFRNILIVVNVPKLVTLSIFSCSLLGLLYGYINIIQISNKNFKPVFDTMDIKMLTHLDSQLKKGDYILSWWDFGWPLWYFTKADTLIDNGKHHHDNYIISKLLLSPPDYTAKAARYFMEQCRGKGCRLSEKLFSKNSVEEVDAILVNIDRNQKKTKDIYFVFYERMLQTLSTIASFSDFDLNTGDKDKNFLIKPFKLQKFIKDKSYVALDGKIDVRMKKGILIADGKKW